MEGCGVTMPMDLTNNKTLREKEAMEERQRRVWAVGANGAKRTVSAPIRRVAGTYGMGGIVGCNGAGGWRESVCVLLNIVCLHPQSSMGTRCERSCRYYGLMIMRKT
jgi:hypothetical protein